MKRLGHAVDELPRLAGQFAGWLIPLMAILVFSEAFARYILRQPLQLADEFAAYMLVALCFLGAAYTWKEKGHVRITVFVRRLPPKVASWLRLITLIFVFAFVLGLFLSSYRMMSISFKFGMASASWLHFPLQGPQMTLPIGFAILLLVLIVDIGRAIKNIRAGKSVEESTT